MALKAKGGGRSPRSGCGGDCDSLENCPDVLRQSLVANQLQWLGGRKKGIEHTQAQRKSLFILCRMVKVNQGSFILAWVLF